MLEPTLPHKNSYFLIIVMGVSGCGKSTVASALAEDLAFRYIEADDYHSREAKKLMSAGKPLTDVMREPWLQRLCDAISVEPKRNTVMAYSGLRRRHRQRFRDLGFDTLFIHLSGEEALIQQRMQARQHFMPVSLLSSQFATLELPDAEPDIVTLDVGIDIQHIIERAHAAVRLRLPKQRLPLAQ
jgi:gluconokinase